MEKYLFLSFGSWQKYIKDAAIEFLTGIARIVYAILMGIVSVLYILIKLIVKWIRNNPVYSLSALSIVLAVSLVLVYVNGSVKAKTYEMQRDSISYEMLKIQEAFVGDTIIVGRSIKRENKILNNNDCE